MLVFFSFCKFLEVLLILFCSNYRMSNGDEPSSNGGICGQHQYSSMVAAGNVFDLVNHSCVVADTMQTGAEAILHNGLNTVRGHEDLVLGSSVRGRPLLSRETRSGHFTEEVFLNTLRNFILEKGGFLGEGWHVEFIQSPYEHYPNPFALYCAPDGKKFESMYDVAHYLGILSGSIPIEIDDRSDGCGSMRKALPPLPPRRRKKDLARICATSRFTENQNNAVTNIREELRSDKGCIPQCYDIKTASGGARSYMEESAVDESPHLSVSIHMFLYLLSLPCIFCQHPLFMILSQKLTCSYAVIFCQSLDVQMFSTGNVQKAINCHFLCFFTVSSFQAGLPLQYEDFFVVRLGKIDLRATYHDSCQIWPVGYKSIWHDKITGSLFQCEVSDGGDSGPVFKVKRCPCSSSPIPNGETIILHNKAKEADTAERMQDSTVIFDVTSNEEEDILMLLSDPIPSEQEFLSCFKSDIVGEPYGPSVQIDMEKTDGLAVERSGKSRSLRDEIGEFYVEGRSSSSVWKMVSRTLVDACQEVYKQSGCFQFCCRHEYGSYGSIGGNLKEIRTGSLARFCWAFGPVETPRVIQSDIELEALCKSLTEWLEHDRFGLDIGFVQEIIEMLPSSRVCSRYQFLVDRSDFSLSFTVGSGLLLARQKNGEKVGEGVSYGLYSGKNRPKLQNLPEKLSLSDLRPPPGQALSSKLPGELVGDVFQV